MLLDRSAHAASRSQTRVRVDQNDNTLLSSASRFFAMRSHPFDRVRLGFESARLGVGSSEPGRRAAPVFFASPYIVAKEFLLSPLHAPSCRFIAVITDGLQRCGSVREP